MIAKPSKYKHCKKGLYDIEKCRSKHKRMIHLSTITCIIFNNIVAIL